MPTTDFSSGTTVTSTWLNEVDAHVFESIQARAWVRATNNGVIAAIVGSNNIASVSRTALGQVLVTFTAQPSDGNYMVVATAHDGANIGTTVNLINGANFTVLTWDADTGVAVDANFMAVVFR